MGKKINNAMNTENVYGALSIPAVLSYGVRYTQKIYLVDASKSTDARMKGSDKTIHELCVESLGRSLDGLRGKLDTRLIVSVYVFSGDGVQCIVKNTLLCDIDTEAVKAAIPRPKGLTPMGKALTQAIEDAEAFKADNRAQGYQFYQPICTLLTDGQPTDDMDKAQEMVDERLAHKPYQRMVLIPVGIGNDDEFTHLKELIRKDPFGDEVGVLGCEDDFSEYVRLVNATTVAVSGGEAFSGMSGLMGSASIFTGQ